MNRFCKRISTGTLAVVAALVTLPFVSAEESQCGLYLAVSSTSTVDETNWGLFSGKDIPANTVIGSPDVGINMPHLRGQNMFVDRTDMEDEQADLLTIVDFFEGFFWVPETCAAKFEIDGGRSVSAVPGAGVLAGYNPKMTNADWNLTAPYFRPQSGEEPGVAHPNRGANSPFYNVQLLSSTDIKAGSEIFMEFGESWADEERKDELEREDFERVDETVEQMMAFFLKHKDSLDEDSKMEIYSFLTKDVLKAAIGGAKARRVATMLPPNPDDLHKVPEAGGSLKFSDPTVFRSLEWLETYGLCMDNIEAKASTIPNAGRGAFATRSISVGGLVAPVPLTHIPNKNVLNMHKLTKASDGGYVRENDHVTTQQMMLNYCYGHPESSMAFFPSGAVASLINHSKKPNAKIVWSKHTNHQKTWLDLGPSELLDEDHMFIGLVFEIVATRNINAGEEVFIDYGPEWVAAYEAHAKEWKKKIASGEIGKDWPLKAVDLNAQHVDVSKPFKTKTELESTPYPPNVSLMAFLLLQETENSGTSSDPKVWGEVEDETAFHHDHLYPVTVVDRKEEDGVFTYTVHWGETDGKATFVEHVPHNALVFVDNADSSDQYFESSFRHYIGIPDDIFPKGAWRNLKP